MKTKFYFAYGMNTNPHEMAFRCPLATPIGRATLPGYRFEFNSFATIISDRNSEVEGVLWAITPSDEAALDVLEGYPSFYRKQQVKVNQGVDYIAMTYIMNRKGNFPPSDVYYGMLSEGYDHFGLGQRQLLDALPTKAVLMPESFD